MNHSTAHTPAASAGPQLHNNATVTQTDIGQVCQWIKDLSNPSKREHALNELCKKHDMVSDLAPMLWHSFGTYSVLLQELFLVHHAITQQCLTQQQSTRLCNALTLLQCMASHSETRLPLLLANIHEFLFPFLRTNNESQQFGCVRLTCLGIICALVKTQEQEVINSLLEAEEMMPLILRIIEFDNILSKTVATVILSKILQNDKGLAYVCCSYERFSHVTSILNRTLMVLTREPSAVLLKYVVKCYLRLSDNQSAGHYLRFCLPDQLTDNTFANLIKDDNSLKWLLRKLHRHLGIPDNTSDVRNPNVP